MRKRKELPLEEIVEKWNNGATQGQLADEYKVNIMTIWKRIKEYYECNKEQTNKPIKSFKKELPVEEIVEKWNNGATLGQLAEEYNVSQMTICKRIKEYYNESNKGEKIQKLRRTAKKGIAVEEIVEKWNNGATQRELAKEYNISQATIWKRIKEYYDESNEGEKTNKPRKTLKKELPVEEIVEKWNNGVTQGQLAEEYSVSCSVINKRIKEYYESNEKEQTNKPRKSFKKEIPVEEIVEKWNNGATQGQLAEEYSVSQMTICKRIKEYYESNERKKYKN